MSETPMKEELVVTLFLDEPVVVMSEGLFVLAEEIVALTSIHVIESERGGLTVLLLFSTNGSTEIV